MKNIFDPLSTAWTAVITHKLRSFLTILGVVIGVAAVIILMSVGKGTEASILSRLSTLGANEIIVRPGSSYRRRNQRWIWFSQHPDSGRCQCHCRQCHQYYRSGAHQQCQYAGDIRKSKFECPGYRNHYQLTRISIISRSRKETYSINSNMTITRKWP